MTRKIGCWFPTVIYENTYNFSQNEKENLISKIDSISKKIKMGGENWHSKIINSCGTYDLLNDTDFKNLNNWIQLCLKDFCFELSCKDDYFLSESWFNIYNKDDFQESHYHAKSVFSCVFFLKAPNGSSPLIFESPLMPDMNTPNYTQKNNLNFEACKYEAKEGQLIIFRSYLRHYVPKHNLEDARITLAYNVK